MSAMIEQVVEVIEEVREGFRSQPKSGIVDRWRLQATKVIAARRNIRQQSVNDKLLRKLRPDINSLSQFDRLVQNWLSSGSEELKNILNKHASDSSDRDLINGAFYIAPEQDVRLAQEFGYDPNDLSFKEGKEQFSLHLQKERNRNLTSLAKKSWIRSSNGNLRCAVCSFSFQESYGKLGQGFIEAHHKLPLSELMPDTVVTVQDLGPVCSNCHSMLHRQRPWISIEQLANIYRQQRGGRA